jgi:hypothetical protein
MVTHDFAEPIFLWHDREDPKKGTRRLDCIEDAFAVLFRADISAYSNDGHDHRVWTAALHHLVSAKADGLAASVHLAHGAMRQLLHAVGVLAPRSGQL